MGLKYGVFVCASISVSVCVCVCQCAGVCVSLCVCVCVDLGRADRAAGSRSADGPPPFTRTLHLFEVLI